MKFLRTSLLISLLALMVNPSISSTAWAGLENNKPHIYPRFPIQDEESFKANTKLIHKTPFNNTKLEFSIRLPNNWIIENISQKKTTVGMNQKLLGEIILSKSPIINAAKAVISIRFISLEREISAENWIKNYINMNNYSIDGKIEAVSNKRASAYFTFMKNGQILHSCATMQMNKNVAIMIQFKIPISLKKPMKFLQKSVVDSFALIMPTDDPIETQKIFSLKDAMRFNYPESWQIYYPNLKNDNDMSLQIHSVTKRGKVDGLIRFIAVRKSKNTNLRNQIAKLKKYFNEFLMIDIKNLVSSDTAPVYDRFLFSRYEVYQAITRKKYDTKKELRFAMMGDKEWYIFVFLLTVSENEDLSSWSRGVQTFDLILDTIR